MADEGDIKVFNPNKEISREITLEILTRHRDAMKQARIGEVSGVESIPNPNQRKFNQVRALNLIISSQREMITISRPIIYFRSMQKWRKTHKAEEDQIKFPFEEFECDYLKLKDWLGLLKACQQDILSAERSKSLEDDYMITREGEEGDINELTTNFYEMLDELESAYEQIFLLMLVNKIVSAGIEEDEELSYKDKEKEAIRRVVDA
tara:strand:+ start:1698 stop:2318 length:621 start_codon:yes stop_codon:yes gene_type:complete